MMPNGARNSEGRDARFHQSWMEEFARPVPSARTWLFPGSLCKTSGPLNCEQIHSCRFKPPCWWWCPAKRIQVLADVWRTLFQHFVMNAMDLVENYGGKQQLLEFSIHKVQVRQMFPFQKGKWKDPVGGDVQTQMRCPLC